MSGRGVATPFYDVKIRAGKRIVIYDQPNESNTTTTTSNSMTNTSTASNDSRAMSGAVNERFFGLATTEEEEGHNDIRDYDEDFEDDDNQSTNLTDALTKVSDRALASALTTMRTRDRDRDRVLAKHVVEDVLSRHKVVSEPSLMSRLQSEFGDDAGVTHYEDLMQHLMDTKSNKEKENLRMEPEKFEHDINVKLARRRARAQSVQLQQQGGDVRQGGGAEGAADVEPDLNSSLSDRAVFDDREQARLLLALEECILQSPRFELDAFETSLVSKDMYANDQVSRQHVLQAAQKSSLKINNETLKLLLQECDVNKDGPKNIYSIKRLVSYLKRSQPVRGARGKRGQNEAKTTSIGLSKLEAAPPSSEKALHTRPSWEVRKPLQRLENRQEQQGADAERKQEELQELQRALDLSYQQTKGYLPEQDVWMVFKTFVSVYKLQLPESAVAMAINGARERGMVHLQRFQERLRAQFLVP